MLFLFTLLACPQAVKFNPFYEINRSDWEWSCRDHEEMSQVLIILDHCLENQYFIKSKVIIQNNDELFGAVLNVSECHWESVIKMEEYQCNSITDVELERLKHLSDTGDSGY